MGQFHNKVVACLGECGIADPEFEAKMLYSLEGYSPESGEPTAYCASKIIELMKLRYAVKLYFNGKLEVF
jgi:hypothetical protein